MTVTNRNGDRATNYDELRIKVATCYIGRAPKLRMDLEWIEAAAALYQGRFCPDYHDTWSGFTAEDRRFFGEECREPGQGKPSPEVQQVIDYLKSNGAYYLPIERFLADLRAGEEADRQAEQSRQPQGAQA